ncbi:MAG: hypothetical protein ACHQTF_11365 [Gemmatimonadales bacterium]|jgi:hypothetical protein
MEREPENEERTPEVDSKDRKGSGDARDATPEQMGASGAGSGKSSGRGGGSRSGNDAGGSRPSDAQGDERQQMGNKKPEPAGPETS